ncbi:MAG: hypothetical protein JSU87_05195 [Gemmatimonadota bacterium]|nr:MAG: hypothetical protein JSU87_05195 [Gemmatimonadota bacterium]
MRGKGLRARHARILGIGLGASLLVHALLLGFGHVSFGTRTSIDGPLNAVSLPDPDRLEAEPVTSPAEDPSLEGIGVQIASLDLADYSIVLEETAGAPGEPLVPRPRIRPEREEHGFTPIRHMPSPALSRLSGGHDGSGATGVTFVFVGGGVGHGPSCHPSDLIGRIPNRRQLPLNTRRLLTPLRQPRR